jgi:hypothetical protein
MACLSSCKENDEPGDIVNSLVGTWQLIEIRIDGNNAEVEDSPEYIRFQANRIYLSYIESSQTLIRGGWSYENGMLNISVDLPAAYYVENVDGKILTLKRQDFNANGEISVTVKEYRRTEDSKIPD